MKDIIILSGSHRKNGNSARIVEFLSKELDIKSVSLMDYTIAAFNYEQSYPTDDEFMALIQEILPYKTIVFLTPMYWYSMSSIMKTFFDRITDLLHKYNEIGQQLKGKSMALIYHSNGKAEEYFVSPFSNTATYLHCTFTGSCHLNMSQNTLSERHKNQLIDLISCCK